MPAAPIQRSRRKYHCPFSRGFFCNFVRCTMRSDGPNASLHPAARLRPSCACLFRPGGRGECRAPSAPAASCAKWVVQDAHEYSQRSHRKSPGIPARNGFTAYFVLSPAIGLSCHRRLADIGTSARSGSRTSARLDAGVEASGPHDFAVRCSAVRLRAQGIAHGSIKPALRSHLARGHRRVHRIPPRVNDDGQRPLCGTGWRGI